MTAAARACCDFLSGTAATRRSPAKTRPPSSPPSWKTRNRMTGRKRLALKRRLERGTGNLAQRALDILTLGLRLLVPPGKVLLRPLADRFGHATLYQLTG